MNYIQSMLVLMMMCCCRCFFFNWNFTADKHMWFETDFLDSSSSRSLHFLTWRRVLPALVLAALNFSKPHIQHQTSLIPLSLSQWSPVGHESDSAGYQTRGPESDERLNWLWMLIWSHLSYQIGQKNVNMNKAAWSRPQWLSHVCV